MEYIYDIILNFHRHYYDFYEWNNTDKIIHIKKIPLVKTDSTSFNRIKTNHIYIDEEFLNIIKDRTICYNTKENNFCLLCNSKQAMAIKLNQSGEIVGKSSLLLDEEMEVIEQSYSLSITPLNIIKETKEKVRRVGRTYQDKENKVKSILNKLDEDKDRYILKYLYYECYLIDKDNNLKTELLNSIKNEEQLIKIYNSLINLNQIKKTYNA